MYVHWQRQFLHPWLVAFDAPTRDECTADRPLSNTPNAALVLLNDPVVRRSGPCAGGPRAQQADRDATTTTRLAWAWQNRARAASRKPTKPPSSQRLLDEHRTQFAADRTAAEALVAVGISPRPKDVDVAELAAWTSVSRVLLNLNETITRN